MSDVMPSESVITPDALKTIAAERMRVYRENMTKCKILQRNILELEKMAKSDPKAEKALDRVRAMLRSAAPQIEDLRKQVEKRLEEFARRQSSSAGCASAKGIGVPVRKFVTDRII
ncbi:hypothetical protein [Burkholderia sp. Bp8986]|uniref:hypothetical protein n=1 Tax=Burkholderia sp. Bp8986 TaxID=2184550 RepID=UPI000F5AD7EF|nr:hypothetical protein [Burkholderia sp. Bp8986]